MGDPPRDANHQEEPSELRQTEPPRRLSNRDRNAFLALLDADHEPNEALKAAAAEYKKGWREGEVYHFYPCDPESEADAAPREN